MTCYITCVLDGSDYNEQVEDLLNISEITFSQPPTQMSILCTPKKIKSKFNNVYSDHYRQLFLN